MPTYTPVNKTYTIWNKDPVNSVTINNFEFTNNANVAHHITYSSAWSAGAGAEWSPGADFTGNETLISKTKTYVSHVGDVNTATAATDYFKGHTPFTQAYTTASTNKLQVDSTTTVGQLVTIGMAITGGGYTGQTVSAFSATVGWMVLSAVGPTTLPAVGTTLTFTDPFPPTLKLVSTATLYTGMIMNGNGFTAGQTVVSIGTDSTVVASADPNTGVYASAIVTFSPPQYVLRVNNNTGLAAGWTTKSEFTYPVSRTVVSTSGTEYLIMSGDVGSSSPSGNIKFVSNTNDMITLAPNTSATWVMYYSANNSTLSNNIANIIIYATQQGNNVQKEINNLVSINQAPSVSNIQPAFDGGGGGNDGGGYVISVETTVFETDIENGYAIPSSLTVTTITDLNGNVVSISVSSTAASYGLANAATDGVAQAASNIGTNQATAAAVNAAVAEAASQAAREASLSTAPTGLPDSDPEGTIDGCPDPNTPILTSPTSSVPAGSLVVGDYIYTAHETTRVYGYYKVLHAEIVEQPKLCFTFEDGSDIIVSTTHRFLMSTNLWDSAFNLVASDSVASIDGNKPIVDITPIGTGPVVKFEIEDAHTYISAGFISHNAKAATPGTSTAPATSTDSNDGPAPDPGD